MRQETPKNNVATGATAPDMMPIAAPAGADPHEEMTDGVAGATSSNPQENHAGDGGAAPQPMLIIELEITWPGQTTSRDPPAQPASEHEGTPEPASEESSSDAGSMMSCSDSSTSPPRERPPPGGPPGAIALRSGYLGRESAPERHRPVGC